MKLKNKQIEVETIEGVNCWQEKTNSKSWFIYTRWDSSFIFNSFDARTSIAGCKKLSCVRHQIKAET
jgi:hypothetical protein